MRAAFRDMYCPPEKLTVRDVDIPRHGPGQLLVRVGAATVNRTDCAILTGQPWVMHLVLGLRRPRLTTTGTDFAGRVEAVGSNVTRFKVGDRVMGFDDVGLQSHAEYLVISQDKPIIPVPPQLSDGQAAALCEGTHYAVNVLNKVDLRAGHQVLVNGASGAIGSSLVQLCKARGAQVTATCTAQTLDLVRSLGADEVIDHAAQDFTARTDRYQFVFDAVGKSSFFKCRHLLLPGGVFTSSELGEYLQNPLLALTTPLLGGKKVIFPVPSDIAASLELVRSLVEQGRFKPVIDRTYPLSEIASAFTYVASGKKVGNVIVTMA